MATKRTQVNRDGANEDGSFTMQEVKTLVQVLEGTDVTSLVWARAGHKVIIRRGQQAPAVAHVVAHAPPPAAVMPVAVPAAPAAAPAPAAKTDKPGTMVNSPLVGTFYRSPSPDSPPYVDVGTAVKKGQVLCIVEAMKLMNEVEAEVEGKIAEILVQNAAPVEFGQPLFRIEPA